MIPLQEQNTCVIGLQWGDEGKGKIVDFLAERADVVVRYCGGANAGHTVRIGTEKYSTHLLPVGVLRLGKMNIIGNGVVLDPAVLFREIDELAVRGIAVTPANLRISYKTHLVMPYHMQEDAAREQSSEETAHRHHTPRDRADLCGQDAAGDCGSRGGFDATNRNSAIGLPRLRLSGTRCCGLCTICRRWTGRRFSRNTAISAGGWRHSWMIRPICFCNMRAKANAWCLKGPMRFCWMWITGLIRT